MAGKRKTWRQSWQVVRKMGVRLPGKSGHTPDVCDKPARGQEEFTGLVFREKAFEETDIRDLRLPRTLFLRCRFAGVSFANTDLRLSCLADCDWIDCDFTAADLACADLRGAELFGCRFVDARLVGADLREAKLTACDFTGADLTGMRLERRLKQTLAMTEIQRERQVDWFDPQDEESDDE